MLTNAWNSVLVHWHKVYSLKHFLRSRWEKETAYENWMARVSWTKKTCDEEKERAEKDLEYSFCFIVVLMCLFAGFFFKISRLVWGSFSEPTPKWAP